MTTGNVTIQIGYYPKSGDNVKLDTKGYYYESGKVRVNLTDEWFPDPEGIYRKFTHTPEDSCTIGDIKKGGTSQNGFGALSSYSSVSVYYWLLDNEHEKPLLIQLGSENEYYIYSGNTWSKDGGINTTTLKSKLDKENCTKNGAHVVDLSQKHGNSSGTTCECPSCNRPSFQVYKSSDSGGTPYYGHTITSISGFKNFGTWQRGLPSIRAVGVIFVYWYNSGTNPLLSVYQRTGNPRFFRKSADNVNSWIEVTDKSPPKETLPTPQIPLDLSKSSGITYDGGSSSISITVLVSPISDGYSKFEHSFRGTSFTISEIKHGQTTQLSGISSSNPLLSVSAYYLGVNDPKTLPMPLLVELRSSGSNTFKYFCRETKDAHTWSKYSGSGGGTGQLRDNALKQALDTLKKAPGRLCNGREFEAKIPAAKCDLGNFRLRLPSEFKGGIFKWQIRKTYNRWIQ
ncbi:hypothetical protein BEWA_012980 [Theileria equi strain WA]|uniref:Uncharacterized protein n=1 Tax=Theileria equi strain WA TaxID=1537102 RepID=L1LBU1_THEEQ|nr:hypothetical protein BEWA_012980 [Theileria equi strain WA]EKX72739.1 hypothetical protein BEWA_012980 [Theileria equi strain WA]|eukprot:XP_004832191.1 hypothetical protein BEWA_012980 [Theileria equi strain WA]